jgi:4-hydroxybenzoate polyprenyltransferase
MKWLQFISERFNPFAYGTMILLVCSAHMTVLHSVFLVSWKVFPLLLIFFGFFFFKLRCYDEIKDYEHDKIHNSTRPLARGLLTVQNMGWAIFVCWIVELIAISLIRYQALAYVLPVMFYTLLMYKEFFVGKFLRNYLTTYALMHTFVFFLLSLAILEGIPEHKNANLTDLIRFALPHWFLFNLFEFARKTFASEEERENVESYSKIFGRIGAVLLSVSQVFLAGLFFPSSPEKPYDMFSSFPQFPLFFTIVLFIAGSMFQYTNNAQGAKLFRKTSELVIVAFYVFYCVRYF